MTTPVTTPPAPARPAPKSDSASTDSAEPFASALDGALDAGRSEVDGAGAQAGGDASAEQEETAADGATAAAVDAATPPPGGVVAALWALLTGATSATPPTDGDPTTPTAPATAVDALPRGLDIARSHGGRAVAHGVRGDQPGALRAAEQAPAPAVDIPATGTTPSPSGPATPATPLPASAAARAVEALAAAGISQIVSETTETTPGADDAAGTAPLAATAPVAVPATTPSTGDASTAPAAAPTTASGALPVAAPPGSGGTAADSGSGSGAGTRDDGTPATDAVQTTGQAAAATSTAPVGRSEAATGAAVSHPVSGQIARHVAVLRGAPDGSHTMTVVLTPDNLGPVEVSVTVSKGALELTLRGAHEHGRAALLDAVPDLRRDLEAAGLTCSRLDVDRGGRESFSSSQQHFGRPGEQGPGGRGSQPDRSDGGARPWHRSADRGDGPRATTRTASGLDVRV